MVNIDESRSRFVVIWEWARWWHSHQPERHPTHAWHLTIEQQLFVAILLVLVVRTVVWHENACLDTFCSQKVHWFHEQPTVICKIKDRHSAGGRKTTGWLFLLLDTPIQSWGMTQVKKSGRGTDRITLYWTNNPSMEWVNKEWHKQVAV